MEAAVIYTRLHGDLKIPFTYRVPDSRGHKAEGQGQEESEGAREGWPASLTDFPLGQWIADARHRHARGRLDAERVQQLEQLGMVWSHHDVAWEEGLTAARGWAKENGHLLAPLDAVHRRHKVGIWLKNARADARAGTLSQERREQLDDIDPSWCPTWPVEWQRAFHLTRQHLETGGTLPTAPGQAVHQGEDLGRWVRARTPRMGPAHRPTAVDVRTRPRHPARPPGRETEATPHTRRPVGTELHRRPPVLRTPSFSSRTTSRVAQAAAQATALAP
ncbi:helicase associated domain-containing protein [Streptomyces sp. GLT-R25]